MSDKEWQQHPETKAFRKDLENRITEIQETSALDMSSADNTLSQTAAKEAKIETLRMVVEWIEEEDGSS